MKSNRRANAAGTGLWPVVSGAASETGDMGRAKRLVTLKNSHRQLAMKTVREAGFDTRDLCSTFSK